MSTPVSYSRRLAQVFYFGMFSSLWYGGLTTLIAGAALMPLIFIPAALALGFGTFYFLEVTLHKLAKLFGGNNRHIFATLLHKLGILTTTKKESLRVPLSEQLVQYLQFIFGRAKYSAHDKDLEPIVASVVRKRDPNGKVVQRKQFSTRRYILATPIKGILKESPSDPNSRVRVHETVDEKDFKDENVRHTDPLLRRRDKHLTAYSQRAAEYAGFVAGLLQFVFVFAAIVEMIKMFPFMALLFANAPWFVIPAIALTVGYLLGARTNTNTLQKSFIELIHTHAERRKDTSHYRWGFFVNMVNGLVTGIPVFIACISLIAQYIGGLSAAASLTTAFVFVFTNPLLLPLVIAAGLLTLGLIKGMYALGMYMWIESVESNFHIFKIWNGETYQKNAMGKYDKASTPELILRGISMPFALLTMLGLNTMNARGTAALSFVILSLVFGLNPLLVPIAIGIGVFTGLLTGGVGNANMFAASILTAFSILGKNIHEALQNRNKPSEVPFSTLSFKERTQYFSEKFHIGIALSGNAIANGAMTAVPASLILLSGVIFKGAGEVAVLAALAPAAPWVFLAFFISGAIASFCICAVSWDNVNKNYHVQSALINGIIDGVSNLLGAVTTAFSYLFVPATTYQPVTKAPMADKTIRIEHDSTYYNILKQQKRREVRADIDANLHAIVVRKDIEELHDKFSLNQTERKDLVNDAEMKQDDAALKTRIPRRNFNQKELAEIFRLARELALIRTNPPLFITQATDATMASCQREAILETNLGSGPTGYNHLVATLGC